MKKITIIILFFSCVIFSQDIPFNKGVNLTNWFQASSAGSIPFTKYTKSDFEDIKNLGVDVIRLPINLHSMTSGSPNYELDPLFVFFLDEVVTWAEDLELHLILDNHTFNPSVDTDPNIDQVLIPVWQNMARHYKDGYANLYYEILNEPHGISDERWNEIQQSVVKEIRKIDSVHTIIVGPAGWNSYNNLTKMPVYDDDNLIYTFHFYDPFLFTHQGASWTSPSMVPLAGVPFPYNSNLMPAVPIPLTGTWIEGAMNNYANDGTEARVIQLINIAAAFGQTRNVPLLCGEFGVYIPNSNNEERAYWYKIVRQFLELKGIAWTIWDYHGGFGVFEKGSNGFFDHDLNIPLLESLNFNIPPQSDYVFLPDTVGFDILVDYTSKNINFASGGNSTVNYYSEKNPHSGKYCMSWSNSSQYGSIGFNFNPKRDLSVLVEEDYVISFWIKTENPLNKIQARFIDTDTEDPEDHPWRMNYDIDIENTEWHKIEIPLKSFVEGGAWEEEWFNPQGLFDWKSIASFQFVAESEPTIGTIFFDDIKIYNPSLVGNLDEKKLQPEFDLKQNYPNPFNPTTTIKYSVGKNVDSNIDMKSSNVKIKVFNLIGQEISTLVNKSHLPGEYEIKFDGSKLSGGIYFYEIQYLSSGKMKTDTKKMLLLK